MSTKREQVISDSEWASMKSMISDQLDNVTTNLEELRSNGSLETIGHMIARGDKCPNVRVYAWYHAMLEAEMLIRPEVQQKLTYMYRSHKANNLPDQVPQSFILDTNLTAQPDGKSKDDWKRRSGRPLENPQQIVLRLEKKRSLSVVERQELWQAKKLIKAAKAKTTKEIADERATTAPDMNHSRKSFTNLAKERRMSAKTSNGVAGRRRPSTTTTRKRSITSSTDRSLGNITNSTNQREAKRQKIPPSFGERFGERFR